VDLIAAVRNLRKRLGLSQQAFANELGLSLRAIANYEKDRRPSGEELARLYSVSLKHRQKRLAATFKAALTAEQARAAAGKRASLGALAVLRLPELESLAFFLSRELDDEDVTPPAKIERARKDVRAMLKIIESINPYTTAPKPAQEDSK
jgi:transcriptional regulator with XRE-family HTH domain